MLVGLMVVTYIVALTRVNLWFANSLPERSQYPPERFVRTLQTCADFSQSRNLSRIDRHQRCFSGLNLMCSIGNTCSFFLG
jgi:hypothetical protein